MAKPRHAAPVGERIRRAREERDWTQTELARRAEIPVSYISKVESGSIRAPSGDYVDKIARVLGQTADDLLRGRTVEPPDDAFRERLRAALGTEKAHLFESVFADLQRLAPADRDQALEVIATLVANWPGRRA